jgi:hypothetical protein
VLLTDLLYLYVITLRDGKHKKRINLEWILKNLVGKRRTGFIYRDKWRAVVVKATNFRALTNAVDFFAPLRTLLFFSFSRNTAPYVVN